jgi:hypothetical protein
MIFVTHNYSPEITQPRKQTFNLPASFATPEFSAVLRFCLFAVRFVRRNQFNIEFFNYLSNGSESYALSPLEYLQKFNPETVI